MSGTPQAQDLVVEIQNLIKRANRNAKVSSLPSIIATHVVWLNQLMEQDS
jgi:hypothetical protein